MPDIRTGQSDSRPDQNRSCQSEEKKKNTIQIYEGMCAIMAFFATFLYALFLFVAIWTGRKLCKQSSSQAYSQQQLG